MILFRAITIRGVDDNLFKLCMQQKSCAGKNSLHRISYGLMSEMKQLSRSGKAKPRKSNGARQETEMG